jgi:hypothetical protein
VVLKSTNCRSVEPKGFNDKKTDTKRMRLTSVDVLRNPETTSLNKLIALHTIVIGLPDILILLPPAAHQV